MVGRLYHLGRAGSRIRARELLERFDLVAAADRSVKCYSDSMRRRLDLAGALAESVKVLGIGPTLDDVFLTLTGHHAEGDEQK